MICELRSDEFERVRPLFSELEHQVVIDSVIDGNTPGRVLVDRPDQPRVSCLWNRMDAIMVAGTAEVDGFGRDLGRVIRHDWAVDARTRHVPFFQWHCWPYAWSELLRETFAPSFLKGVERTFYDWRGPDIGRPSTLPPNSIVSPLDGQLLARQELRNLERVVGWIRSFWHSVPSFVAHGIGSCLIIDDEIVSWCLTVFVGGHRVELGVETALPHRGRNYATVTTAACVRACLAHNLDPIWQCDKSNRPSVAVAQKVGFRPRTDYTVLRLRLDQLDGDATHPGNSFV